MLYYRGGTRCHAPNAPQAPLKPAAADVAWRKAASVIWSQIDTNPYEHSPLRGVFTSGGVRQ